MCNQLMVDENRFGMKMRRERRMRRTILMRFDLSVDLSVVSAQTSLKKQMQSITFFIIQTNYIAPHSVFLFFSLQHVRWERIFHHILRKCMQFWTFSFDCWSFHLLYTVQVCAWKCTINQLNVNWNFKCERNSSFLYFFLVDDDWVQHDNWIATTKITKVATTLWNERRFFFLSQKLIFTFDRLWHFTDSDANTNFMHTFRNQLFRRFYFYFV